MGVIVKYQLVFPEVGLNVTNDPRPGDFLIEADIRARTSRGVPGGVFEIALYDLPLAKAQEINRKVRESAGLTRVLINLGYFDGSFEQVMEGVITKVNGSVSDNKLVTTVSGEEMGTWTLRNNQVRQLPAGDAEIADALRALLRDAQIARGQIDRVPRLENISGSLRDKIFRGRNLMEVLDELAEYVNAELLVTDQKVFFGKPVKYQDYTPPQLEEGVNLASFQAFDSIMQAEQNLNLLNPLKEAAAEWFRFTAVGDPKLRSGNKVVAAVEGFEDPSSDFRVCSLDHRLTANNGYVCEGTAIKAVNDDKSRRRETAASTPNAGTVAAGLTRHAQAEQRNRPSIEIGQVKAHDTEKRLSTLYFGQRAERTETQPSVRTEVDTDEQQLLRNKPLVSPFAWRKCGLLVPVYPGMRALLSHNRDLLDDALVSGFIWSEKPANEPPKGKEGDWWLCLPIDFDTNNPPADDAKAVNDLTANNGKRVIEVKGLKITIGADKLPNVGARPTEGADDEFLIEHKSGARIRIADDGALSIEASSISIKGDVTVEGNVEVK
jgi:hypothetical protein